MKASLSAALAALVLVACGGGDVVDPTAGLPQASADVDAQAPMALHQPMQPQATRADYGDAAYRMYQAAFARAPDTAGLNYYIEMLSSGRMTLKSMARGFLNSPEFKARYGDPGPRTYVIQLYRNVLGRAPDIAGEWFHTKNLVTGVLDEADTLVSFAESPENVKLVAAKYGRGSTTGAGLGSTTPPSGTGSATGTGSGTTAPNGTGWSDWLFVDADKAVQVRFEIADRSGNDGLLKVEYRVNTNDAIHCRFMPTSCTHYVLVTNHLDPDVDRSYLFAANTTRTIAASQRRQLKFPGGYELTWTKARGIVHTQNGSPTGLLWSTDCVDDVFPGTSIARTNCRQFNASSYTQVN